MKNIILTLLTFLTITFIIFSGCPTTTETETPPTIVNFAGSDPKGDLVGVEMDKTNKKITLYNYTTGEKKGPFSYSKVTDTTITGGFNIIYKTIINTAGDYVLFAEFPDAAIVYVLFNKQGEALGNFRYLVKREKIENNKMYAKAYNWMKFKIDEDGSADTDMETGFVGIDTDSTQGLFYGACYSHKAEMFEWSGYINGIKDINPGDTLKVNSLVYDKNTNSSYHEAGGSGMGHRLYLTGTPSGSIILDFGIQRGGGGGIAIPQAETENMSNAYYGVYLTFLYEYSYKSGLLDQRKIKPIKVLINKDNTGDFVKGFDLTQDISTTPHFIKYLKSVNSLQASESPGGIKVTDQFATQSGNAGASSDVVKNANRCYGEFINMEGDSTYFTVNSIIFDPQGRFLSFTGFTNSLPDSTSDYEIRFGFAIKDPGYSY